jgi:integrase
LSFKRFRSSAFTASNPIAAVKLLRKPNVRRSVLDDAAFEKLLALAESQLKPIILVAYDTGMRRVYAQVEIFLQGLKKPEAISIPWPGGLPSDRPV